MRWIEVIQLRSVNNNRATLDKRLKELMKDAARPPAEHTVKIYHRELIDTDTSVVIFQDRHKPEPGGSRLGMHLAEALKAFGLVRHSIWIEKDPS